MVECYVPRPLAHSRLGPQESELSAHKLAATYICGQTYMWLSPNHSDTPPGVSGAAQAVRQVSGVQGDIVEAGVFRGGTSHGTSMVNLW